MRRTLVSIVGACLCFASTSWADVPAPPVNQDIGMPDIALGDMTEADCRVCHSSAVNDRHHLLYGQPIPPGSIVPYPDGNGDGNPDDVYGCLNCHDQNFTVVTDCVACHTASPHHTTPAAVNGDCQSCHGDLVDNIGDGHYVPSDPPTLQTPSPSRGDGSPNNSRGNGAGACNYCHDNDGLPTPVVLTNAELHHAASMNCLWCHSIHGQDEYDIRVCEGCHGPDSLHYIQADSPRAPTGTIVVGGEDPGYGHVGSDSDCWGCHGFAMPSAPAPGPLVPTIHSADLKVMTAGTDTMVVLSGSAFTNTADGTPLESNVALTAADGSTVFLTPDLMDEGVLAVTIPRDIAVGNYDIQVAKGSVRSNPAAISVIPEIIITDATLGRTVTIAGSGFGGYADGLGISVTGTIPTGDGRNNTTTVEATIVSWSDTMIEAEFDSIPSAVAVHSVFGNHSTEGGRTADTGEDSSEDNSKGTHQGKRGHISKKRRR